MLCLSRLSNEPVILELEDGRIITVTPLPNRNGGRVHRIGFKAPKGIRIYRSEIWEQVQAQRGRTADEAAVVREHEELTTDIGQGDA